MFRPFASVAEIPTVDRLVAYADKTIAGLDKAKRRVALLLFRHMMAAFHGESQIVPNLLIIGPSGGGKSMLVKTMLEACMIPWTEGKATEYSPSGFTGRDMPSMYAGLTDRQWQGVQGFDEKPWTKRQIIELAQRYGVVFLDEFDKIRTLPNVSPDKDLGRPMQAELLTYTEGTTVWVSTDGGRGYSFDTTNILHIAVGAFEGLDDVMLKIDGIKDPTPQDKLAVHLEVDAYDIVKYGFLPELVGRFATMIPLPNLNHESMTRILREHTIPAYASAVEATGCHFLIEDGAVAWLAGEATKSKVGARGIPPLFEELLGETWSKAHLGDTIAVTANSVQQRTSELHKAERRATA